MTTPQHDEASPVVISEAPLEVRAGVEIGHLTRILADAALFASRDDTLPMINQVKLEGDGNGNLVAVGTNRFVVGAARCNYTGNEFEAGVSLPDLVILQKLLSAKRMAKADATLSISEHFINVYTTTWTMRVPRAEGELPKWKQLIPDVDVTTQVSSHMAYNFGYLGLFNKVGGAYESPRIYHQGGKKPAVITVGPDFIGLIMPIRIEADSALAVPAWAR